MSTILTTAWSEDWCELTVTRQTDSGTLTTTYGWDEPPDEHLVVKALEERDLSQWDTSEGGSGHRASRHQLPFGLELFVHVDWGPPRWTLPRLRPRINRERASVDVGWLYRCYGLRLSWKTPEEQTASPATATR